MSTLRAPMRLLAKTVAPGLVALSVVAAGGCTSIAGSRLASLGSGPPSKAKTTLAVGDRPLPVVTGEPGSSVAADTDPEPSPGRAAQPNARISGRVYDADGAPVPNARVRLAVSGALGGKVVSATTDRSGAFTLRGLRPGSTYTVIAEWQGNDGKLAGRSSASAADTDVRITLAAAGSDDTTTPNRVRGVSERAVPDEEADRQEEILPGPAGDSRGRPRANSRVNEEDLPPPAEAGAAPAPEAEAEAMAPVPTNKSRAAVSNRRTPPATWRRGQAGEGAGTTTPPASASSAELEPGAEPKHERPPHDPEARATAASPAVPEDDGPNPLPPALETGPPPKIEPSPDAAPVEEAFAPKREPGGKAKPQPSPFDPANLAALEQTPESRPTPGAVSSSESAAPRSLPSDEAPRLSQRIVPQTYVPVILDPEQRPSPRGLEMFDRESAPSPEPRANAPATTETQPEPSVERRRPTWGEVTELSKDSDGKPRDRAIRLDTTVAKRTVAGTKADAATVFCDYDDRHRRLIDFRLPDLEGKPVRFKEIDADLVLIDFWGTWCGPCLNSIPHLVELQDRMKGKKLVVLGVACEPDAPEVAKAKVAAAARKMSVNYPILLGRNDGTCPLQEAFRIQAFPTMILLDREGRVLWRDQGATAATLARLDRMVNDPPVEKTRR